MKDRFNILDTYAISRELQYFKNCRLNNIYDIDNKTFLLKFDDFQNKKKIFIIIKSGIYLYHILHPPQDRRRLPTSFCMKLRKHIKNKRLKSIDIVKCDRTLQLIFGSEEHQYKLIIELFSLGNIILCDKNDIIISLLRTHVYQNGNVILVNNKYPYEQLNNEFNSEFLKDIEYINDNSEGYYTNKEISPVNFDNANKLESFNTCLNKFIKIKKTNIKKKKKKIKLTPEESIKKHSFNKIERLKSNITKINNQIIWMNENHELINKLIATLEPNNKENIIIYNEYQLIKSMNYYQNINYLYQKIKEINEKINKTKIGSENAINKLKKIKRKKIDKIENITINHNKWYHDYNWFYTSNKFLVICGRNSTQSEQIVKKHMNNNDIYIHSEVSGSGSAIIKNPNNKNINPIDLEEAGSFVISYSKAWKDKAPDYAYWVNPLQVSKTTESGEFVQKGSFIIRGKRNYIYRTELELGCTIYENQLMIAPYKCVQKIDKNKIKITPGSQKRKKTLNIIIKKLKIDNKSYDIIDKNIPNNIRINYNK